MLHFSKFAAAAAMLAATVSFAGAQGITTPFKPFSLGVSAGASIPTGDLSNNVNTGYNITGHVGVAVPALPISFRGDVGYNNWGAKAKTSSYNDHAWGFTANALVDLPVAVVVHPYVIGGIGGYRFGRSAGDVTVNDNTTRFGYNLGGGINLPLSGFSTFVEARYNHANRDIGSSSFVPITFGVMF